MQEVTDLLRAVCLVGGTNISSAFDVSKKLISQLPAQLPQASRLALADIEQVLASLRT